MGTSGSDDARERGRQDGLKYNLDDESPAGEGTPFYF
jgi:hypothetical protein